MKKGEGAKAAAEFFLETLAIVESGNSNGNGEDMRSKFNALVNEKFPTLDDKASLVDRTRSMVEQIEKFFIPVLALEIAAQGTREFGPGKGKLMYGVVIDTFKTRRA